MENNKSHGNDGLPAEFYKVFWRDINVLYLNAINFGHKIGKLSISQRRGIIKLIPKKSRILQLLKNWRPITLLNCDYKIATKAIANRLKTVLSTLISNDQTGFLQGRSISENARLIEGILRYSDFENIPGLLLFVDFEKALDTLEWRFVEKVFTCYNFGPSFITWIKTFYNDIQSTIFNNGWSSGFFNLERGVRQGCPLSPYVFILCAEILSSAIRRDKEIKGIKITKTECKITQYADDTTLFLDGSNLSLKASLLTFERFGKISGLKMNNSKTEAMWIGKSKDRTDILFPEKKLTWSASSVKALGVYFSTSEDQSMIQNHEEKINKIKELCDCWSVRRLTLLGKITVVKSLLASQLVYTLTPLRTHTKTLKEVNNILYTFIWDGKGDKIKRTVMINKYENERLKMLDIDSSTKLSKQCGFQNI